jgi:hypothetical protein
MIMKSENLYLKFISQYTDRELLKGIENRTDFAQDVFKAIISESQRRNLLSPQQIEELNETSENAGNEVIELEDEVTVRSGDFWKCPKCGQTVELSFDACWNCRMDKPEKIEHPTKTDIVDYKTYKQPFNYFKAGFSLIGLGLLVLILSYSMTFPDFWGYHYLPLGKFLAGFVFVGLGFAFILFGLFSDQKKKLRP